MQIGTCNLILVHRTNSPNLLRIEETPKVEDFHFKTMKVSGKPKWIIYIMHILFGAAGRIIGMQRYPNP